MACEIATGDELVGTEIIFAGVLADIPPEEAVALLASLVFQEKNASPPELSGSLKDACERAKALAFAAGRVGTLSRRYLQSKQQWMNDSQYIHVTKLTPGSDNPTRRGGAGAQGSARGAGRVRHGDAALRFDGGGARVGAGD